MYRYKFTIFTPSYNREDKLYRVYESIKNQTLKKVDEKYIFEWIIVDDGSIDNTKDLVLKWQSESHFEIVYFYQQNQGKPAATRQGIELSNGELFLLCDSDDAFIDDTLKIFYNLWENFSNKEKENCGGIACLCEDQFGKRVGVEYPIENQFVANIDTILDWSDIGLGETWAALNTKNLKKYFTIPNKAKKLKFIPESFFWSRITFEKKPYSYCINKVLRIYYKDENDNISNNIREKFPEGFLFESKWFIKKYYFVLFKHPKIYIKHLIKYVYYSLKLLGK